MDGVNKIIDVYSKNTNFVDASYEQDNCDDCEEYSESRVETFNEDKTRETLKRFARDIIIEEKK